MDKLDIRIYREFFHARTGPPLGSDIRKSYRGISRKLRIDEVTVRNRIGKLRASGFLKGWRAVVNPSLLGVKWVQLWLDVRPPCDKAELIKKIASMGGVLTISDYYGSALTIILLRENEVHVKEQFELIKNMAHSENPKYADIPFPQCAIKLKQTDWEIIKAIQEDTLQSYPLISRKVGVSSKTVKRRLERMIDGNALFLIPSLNPRALDGAILMDLVVFYTSPESKREVDSRIVRHLDEQLIRAELYDKEHGFFNLIIRNVSKAREILDWVRMQSGVGGVFVELVLDRIELYESLDAEPSDRTEDIPCNPMPSCYSKFTPVQDSVT